MSIQAVKFFDSHKMYEDLKRGGFTEEQADSLVKSVVYVNFQDISNLATKDQLIEAEEKLSDKINAVEEDLTNKINAVEEKLTNKINSVEEKLTARINSVEEKLDTIEKKLSSEIRGEAAGIKFDIIKWMLPFLVAIVIAVVYKG